MVNVNGKVFISFSFENGKRHVRKTSFLSKFLSSERIETAAKNEKSEMKFKKLYSTN